MTDRRIRLAERILAGNTVLAGLPDDNLFNHDAFVAELPNVTKVVADNVTAWYYALPNNDMRSPDHLPNVAPPWSSFWIETAAPRFVWERRSQSHEAWPDRVPVYWGLYVESDDHGEHGLSADEAVEAYAVIFDNPNGGVPHKPVGRVRWVLQMSFYAMSGGDMAYGPMEVAYLLVDPDGRVVPFENGDPCYVGIASEDALRVSGLDSDKLINETLKMAQPLLVALSFMHMKNVVIAETKRPRADRRAVQRDLGIGPEYFRTVQIDPAMDVILKSVNPESVGLARAMHLCRGHFATYTEDAPLLGKYTGQYWRRAHWRGSRARGLVRKGYEVHEPKGLKR